MHELDVTTEGPRSRSASLRGRSASLKVSEFNAQRGTGCGRHKYTMIYTAVEGCEPVWPSGKALGWQVEGPRFDTASALLSLQKGVWFVGTVL